MYYLRSLIAIILSVGCVSCEPKRPGDLKLNPLFSHHMVLQQQTGVSVWGTYNGSGLITVQGSWGSEASATPNESGVWSVRITTPAAGGPFEVSVVAPDTMTVIKDVMIGEVWLASGQSNMEMPLAGWPPNDPILNSDQEIAQADYPEIRMFTVVKNISRSPLDSLEGTWEVATPQTAETFSATAYFFARRLHQQLDVPVGILHTSWGGTVAEAWTSPEQLRTLGDFDKALDQMQNPDIVSETTAWFDQHRNLFLPQSEDQWELLELDDLPVPQPDYDDANWSTTTLPGRYDELPSGEINGAIWVRHRFDIPTLQSDYQLNIGAVDDMDAAFINGQKVGSLLGPGHWNTPRNYQVPTSLLSQGTNTVSIRAIDTGGPGVINGPINLSHSGGTISLEGEWKYRPVAEIYQNQLYVYDLNTLDISSRPQIYRVHQNLPSVLYNAMMHPLIPYTIKGAIWYQGESNVGRAAQYKKLFPAMIADWRNRWGYEFPFYFVQIAPFQYQQNLDPTANLSQKLREAQRYALQTPQTGMVVTMDIGNFTNIHPANKQDVGGRLAGLALANDYGKELVVSGPLFKGVEKTGNKLLVDFYHKGSGLMAKDQLSGFEIAGADKIFFQATATIVENKLQVFSPAVPEPEFVRYAWRDQGVATLVNHEGFPASSFSSLEAL